MAVNYDLNNTGPEVQTRLDQVLPNKSDISVLEMRVDAHDTEIADRYTKAEVNALVSPEAPTITVATRAELDEITEHPNGAVYRVANYDGTQVVSNKFTEYGWDGTQYLLLDVKDIGIDTTVTEGSGNLPTSGAVFGFKDATMTTDEDIAPTFCINDEDQNSIVAFKDGHVITKNFNSELSPETMPEESINRDLVVADGEGNALLVVDKGKIVTKEFNSADGFYNDWKGKNICFLGDSIIEQGFVINAVEQFLGCTAYNRGWGGAMITPTEYLSHIVSPDNAQPSDPLYSNKAYAFTGRFDQATNNKIKGWVHLGMPDPSLIDLLVIHGGCNDYAHGSGSSSRDVIKLGNSNEAMGDDLVNYKKGHDPESEGSSFAAALKYTCYKARLKYPKIPIALCTIFSSYTCRDTSHTEGIINSETMEVTPVSKDFNGTTGVTVSQMNEIIRTVARQFGFYVIDMEQYSATGINEDFAKLNFRPMVSDPSKGDLVHPSNPYGAWNYGVYMAKQILNNIPYVDKSLADIYNDEDVPDEDDE